MLKCGDGGVGVGGVEVDAYESGDDLAAVIDHAVERPALLLVGALGVLVGVGVALVDEGLESDAEAFEAGGRHHFLGVALEHSELRRGFLAPDFPGVGPAGGELRGGLVEAGAVVAHDGQGHQAIWGWERNHGTAISGERAQQGGAFGFDFSAEIADEAAFDQHARRTDGRGIVRDHGEGEGGGLVAEPCRKLGRCGRVPGSGVFRQQDGGPEGVGEAVAVAVEDSEAVAEGIRKAEKSVLRWSGRLSIVPDRQ